MKNKSVNEKQSKPALVVGCITANASDAAGLVDQMQEIRRICNSRLKIYHEVFWIIEPCLNLGFFETTLAMIRQLDSNKYVKLVVFYESVYIANNLASCEKLLSASLKHNVQLLSVGVNNPTGTLAAICENSSPDSSDNLAECVAKGKASHKPVIPLTSQHTDILRLLAARLTIYEVAAHLEMEWERVLILKRQAFLRLGVTNLKDALASSGITAPKDRPVRPRPIRRPDKRAKDAARQQMLELIGSIFKPIMDAIRGEDQTPIGYAWPDNIWILYNERTTTYSFIITPKDNVTCLVCLSSQEQADEFLRVASAQTENNVDGCVPQEVSFDNARAIAQARDDVQALLLFDAPGGPIIHNVR